MSHISPSFREGESPWSAQPFSVDVQFAIKGSERQSLPRKRQVRVWAAAALRTRLEAVTIRVVGADEAKALNKAYRGKDYATNVLSFVYSDAEDVSDHAAGRQGGDLVICMPVVAREARDQEKSIEAHFAHLVVHGMLHLQGLDHETDTEAEQMEALEIEILANLGFDSPYR